jgi:hypothetical protein
MQFIHPESKDACKIAIDNPQFFKGLKLKCQGLLDEARARKAQQEEYDLSTGLGSIAMDEKSEQPMEVVPTTTMADVDVTSITPLETSTRAENQTGNATITSTPRSESSDELREALNRSLNNNNDDVDMGYEALSPSDVLGAAKLVPGDISAGSPTGLLQATRSLTSTPLHSDTETDQPIVPDLSKVKIEPRDDAHTSNWTVMQTKKSDSASEASEESTAKSKKAKREQKKKEKKAQKKAEKDKRTL